jgi:hypothetical protein
MLTYCKQKCNFTKTIALTGTLNTVRYHTSLQCSHRPSICCHKHTFSINKTHIMHCVKPRSMAVLRHR